MSLEECSCNPTWPLARAASCKSQQRAPMAVILTSAKLRAHPEASSVSSVQTNCCWTHQPGCVMSIMVWAGLSLSSASVKVAAAVTLWVAPTVQAAVGVCLYSPLLALPVNQCCVGGRVSHSVCLWVLRREGGLATAEPMLLPSLLLLLLLLLRNARAFCSLPKRQTLSWDGHLLGLSQRELLPRWVQGLGSQH
jgi:hypothetical protein